MSNYTHSGQMGVRLSTTTGARLRRAVTACFTLSHFANLGRLQIRETNQASASVACVDRVEILISYTTAVAMKDSDGVYYATEHGEFSRTTDRSVSQFVPPQVIRLNRAEFAAVLEGALERLRW